MLHKRPKFGRNRIVTKGTLILRPKQFIDTVSPCIEAEWLTWHCSAVASNVWSKSGTIEGYFTLDADIIFVPIWPCIPAGWFKYEAHTPSPCCTTYANLSKSGCNEGHITLQTENFSSLLRLVLQAGDSNMTLTLASQCSKSEVSLFEIWQHRRALYSFRRKSFSSKSRLVLQGGWGVTQIRHVTLPHHARKPLQVWSESGQ
jgi:hypothetical protein